MKQDARLRGRVAACELKHTRVMILLIALYIVFILVYMIVFTYHLSPFLQRHLETTSRHTLGYPQWVYKDEDEHSAYRGATRLAQDVARYATDRYEASCLKQKLWHVFLHSASGRPFAVEYDRTSNVISKSIYIDRAKIESTVLRRRALCSEDPVESHFVISQQNAVDTETYEEDRLRALARRYSYRVLWRNKDNQTYLVIVFTDKPSQRDIEFEFPDYWAVAGNLGELTARDSLPPVWTLQRSADLVRKFNTLSNPGQEAPNDSLAGLHVKVESPCYNRASNRVRPGLYPVTNLRQLEQLYLRGVGSYDYSVSKKLDRLYFECRYDVPVEEEEEVTRDIPLRLYLRVCPSDSPLFDANLRVCLNKRLR